MPPNKSVKIAESQQLDILFEKDIWEASEVGLQARKHRRESKLIFSHIRQSWLKDIVKRFVRYIATNRKFGTLLCYLTTFNDFSLFLQNNYPFREIEVINRQLIIDYLNYLNAKNLSSQHKTNCLSCLKLFLETGLANKWFILSPYLIRQEDFPKHTKSLPRYIPEDVIKQLNQHLNELPEPVMRMVLVIQECGLRVGELCQLPLDCLKQDSKGNWYIQFMRWKMLKEDTIPISFELAATIQEQHKYILENFHDKFDYLFCARFANGKGDYTKFHPKSKIISCKSFINFLKDLAQKYDIRDSSGKIWNFQSHQFRHTVGTRMINNGVPQHIVQRYLGHDSPQMTAVYAQIHDATLRKEIDKYLGSKIVNINGEVIESLNSELDNDANLQWMKKKVVAETLPNGYCGLPAQLTCSKGNACITCGDFRTTIEFLNQHKEHLERTKEVLEVAEASGWQRQIQLNQDVKKS